MPVDGGEPGRSVRDLQRGTDTLVAIHRGAPIGGEGRQGGREASNGGVLKMLSRRASERAGERASKSLRDAGPCRVAG